MMDTLTDPAFWGEVGLATAGRIALLAAVVWVARLAGHPRVQPQPIASAPKVAVNAATTSTRTTRSHHHNNRLPDSSARFVNLRSHTPDARADAATSSQDTKPNEVRDRLMEYVGQQTMEGVGA